MADLVRHAVGVDLVEVALRFALGEPVPDELALPRFSQPLAIRFLTASPGPLPTGRVTRIGDLDAGARERGSRPGRDVPRRRRDDSPCAPRRRPARLRDRDRGHVVRGSRSRRAGRGAARGRGRVSDPRLLVGAGYDAMVEHAGRPGRRGSATTHGGVVRRARPTASSGARVIELGCGGGTTETQLLAQRFRLTGVDLSPSSSGARQSACPTAGFLHADFTASSSKPGSVDAVASFYVLNHVPRELLARSVRSGSTGGSAGRLFLTTLGASDTPGWTGDFLGAPSYFSSFRPETNTPASRRGRLRAAPRRARHDPRARGRRDLPLGVGRS